MRECQVPNVAEDILLPARHGQRQRPYHVDVVAGPGILQAVDEESDVKIVLVDVMIDCQCMHNTPP